MSRSDVAAVCGAVRSLGGVARVGRLRELGHSRHHIDRALAGDGLQRVRRDWVSLPGADPELVAAARAGVTLSCVTQARRLGLWVLYEGVPHVAATPHARGHKPSAVVVHWAEPTVPRPPDCLADPIENVLVTVARCQPPDLALAVWESALRQRLVEPGALARLVLPPAARDLLDQVEGISDSGLETLFRTRLRWLDVRIIAQAWIAGHRVDFLIGERLVVQIDGGHHVGAQRTSDIAHDAALTLLGYHVIRLSYSQIVHDWPGVQDIIVRAVAQRLHRAAS